MIVPRLTNDAATQVLYPLLWASDAGLQRHRAEDSGLGAGAPLDLALVEGLKLALALAEVWRCGGRARGAAGRERDGSLEEAQPLRDLSGEESDDVLVVGGGGADLGRGGDVGGEGLRAGTWVSMVVIAWAAALWAAQTYLVRISLLSEPRPW